MTVRRTLLVCLGLALLLAGCSAILGIHEPEIVGASEAGITDDAPSSAHADAADEAGVAPNRMVTIPRPADAGGGTFQIDVTEVTQAQYADFLARGTSSVLQHPKCGTNGSFRPAGGFSPTITPDLPVVGVDWCDAYAYCQAVSKRLCGGADGVPGALSEVAVAGKNEWLSACTRGDTQAFPYGTLERPTACNTVSADAGVLLAVTAKPFCEGGFAGVFDLVGNVAEWVDLCNETQCATMGGSYSFPPRDVAACATSAATARLTQFADIGFRCCR